MELFGVSFIKTQTPFVRGSMLMLFSSQSPQFQISLWGLDFSIWISEANKHLVYTRDDFIMGRF